MEVSEEEANKRLEQERNHNESPIKNSYGAVQGDDLKTHLLDKQPVNQNDKYVINNETVEKRELETPKAGINPGTRNMQNKSLVDLQESKKNEKA